MLDAEGDTGRGLIDDHVFEPPPDAPWDRCVICKLAESAHRFVDEPYRPTARRRPEP